MADSELQKIIILCRRRDGLTHDQVRRYQLDHAELVRGLHPVKHYKMNFPLPAADGADPAYDVVVEIWVDSMEAYHAVLQTPEGIAAREHADEYVYLDDAVVLVSDEVTGW